MEDADTRMDQAALSAHTNALDNIMKTAQTQKLQAVDEDEEMGLNLFHSRDLTVEHVPSLSSMCPELVQSSCHSEPVARPPWLSY